LIHATETWEQPARSKNSCPPTFIKAKSNHNSIKFWGLRSNQLEDSPVLCYHPLYWAWRIRLMPLHNSPCPAPLSQLPWTHNELSSYPTV